MSGQGGHSGRTSPGIFPEQPFPGGGMYEKPRVQRFGTFRELTAAGWDRDNDGLVVFGIGGDNLCGGPDRPDCPWDTTARS